MKTSKELIKAHLLRFYATFTSTTSEPNEALLNTQIEVWTDTFGTWAPEAFTQACRFCEITGSQHPVPADIHKALHHLKP